MTWKDIRFVVALVLIMILSLAVGVPAIDGIAEQLGTMEGRP